MLASELIVTFLLVLPIHMKFSSGLPIPIGNCHDSHDHQSTARLTCSMLVEFVVFAPTATVCREGPLISKPATASLQVGKLLEMWLHEVTT